METEIFCPLAHILNNCKDQNWTNPKPEAKSFTRVSHVDAGIQGTGPSSTVFLDTLSGSWIGSKSSRTQVIFFPLLLKPSQNSANLYLIIILWGTHFSGRGITYWFLFSLLSVLSEVFHFAYLVQLSNSENRVPLLKVMSQSTFSFSFGEENMDFAEI